MKCVDYIDIKLVAMKFMADLTKPIIYVKQTGILATKNHIGRTDIKSEPTLHEMNVSQLLSDSNRPEIGIIIYTKVF